MPPADYPFHFAQLFGNDWLTFLIFLGAISLLLGISEVLRRIFRWAPESTRKFVHVSVGVLMLFTPFLFVSNRPPIVLAIVFVFVNFVAIKSRKLGSIHSTQRKTYGTLYFPFAYLLLCLFWWQSPIVYEIALLLMAIADTAAAVAGERASPSDAYVLWEDRKTIQGSVVMFLSSVILVGFGASLFHRLTGMDPPDLQILVPVSFFVAIMATIAEAVSSRGSDNLSVPLVAAVTYDLTMASVQQGGLLVLFLWVLASLIFALGALRLSALALDGALGSFVVGVFVFGIGQWKFTIPLAVFFTVSSLLSKIGKDKKESMKMAFGKGSKRDIVQVFANGGVPMLVTICWLYSPSDWLYAVYLASVAAASADTWATEIGFFSRRPPRHSISFKRVEPGASGGVTLLGTSASLAGSAAIAFAGYLFLPDANVLKLVIIAGFVASVVDSVLGATIQGQYQCSICRKTTESSAHCHSSAILLRGLRFVNNDGINLVCTLSGGTLLLLAAPV